jgi:uncharacterized protein (TIGR02996 family)
MGASPDSSGGGTARAPEYPPPPRPGLLSLFRAARESPRDNAPRLALADWLKRHGGGADAARGAFVRIQVELARLGPDAPAGTLCGGRNVTSAAATAGPGSAPCAKGACASASSAAWLA